MTETAHAALLPPITRKVLEQPDLTRCASASCGLLPVYDSPLVALMPRLQVRNVLEKSMRQIVGQRVNVKVRAWVGCMLCLK